MEKLPCVYMLASGLNGTLYIGVTSNLIKCVFEHRQETMGGFTKRYGTHDLVWYEVHETTETAFLREKQLKKWDRRTKLRLIEQQNPEWRDLAFDLVSPSNRKTVSPGAPEPPFHVHWTPAVQSQTVSSGRAWPALPARPFAIGRVIPALLG
ncbi:GIY-YIG nuclease family protein [Methylocaldum sp. RMAD-M]|jgi:putative endonuclease|uniref:GIY-YIG nuclease family protein n=1 Tax=Methylocaldum sp. RMAD-M TaxID=2806557 RepID=UPI001AE48D05|nr:GIY-YIG nuclease family protein [Methylocaldum sp. RMAD-M]